VHASTRSHVTSQAAFLPSSRCFSASPLPSRPSIWRVNVGRARARITELGSSQCPLDRYHVSLYHWSRVVPHGTRRRYNLLALGLTRHVFELLVLLGRRRHACGTAATWRGDGEVPGASLHDGARALWRLRFSCWSTASTTREEEFGRRRLSGSGGSAYLSVKGR
jgi:hypothetical protein